ncbi:hypothetical protein PBI_THONKO_33 [Mycobacterium phage Thonko]|uniref:Uncharacterized protein n=1 Tax=Mycobacterium phage Thonko TaxID=2282910 RepID=A0A346FC80_9CAUD|nr:hypothetical protein I5G57_gp033 [Mycobacterium phage Thonko]AXN53305.1 hypothetical protein PBI_THONKO_33 [Mycobacterium phage Thonko]
MPTESDSDFDWGVGFDVATIPADMLPVRPTEPVPPLPGAPNNEQTAYAAQLAEYQRLLREYEGQVAALLSDDTHWTFTVRPCDSREDADLAYVEMLSAHATNPLVRNVSLCRTPTIVWERVS